MENTSSFRSVRIQGSGLHLWESLGGGTRLHGNQRDCDINQARDVNFRYSAAKIPSCSSVRRAWSAPTEGAYYVDRLPHANLRSACKADSRKKRYEHLEELVVPDVAYIVADHAQVVHASERVY